jgi:hypothetical protein
MRALLETIAVFALLASSMIASDIKVSGHVIDGKGYPIPAATVQLSAPGDLLIQHSSSDSAGRFLFLVALGGDYVLTAIGNGFEGVSLTLSVTGPTEIDIRLEKIAVHKESVTVTADINESDVLSPDPGEKVFVREGVLDANPGRPGAPVSIPGYPIETASSGIKAPQYFAPGVAGDHGEPIAQYILVGAYLVPNNLSANAHGNGYADPNIFIPEVLESVQVDGGAYNVREGNHSVNLAATYGLRSGLDPFLAITGDYRDIDVAAGFTPSPDSWLTFSGSLGNGFLKRLEHRQQYKVNGEHLFHTNGHKITLFGLGYFGVSKTPGLVPIFPTNSDDANFPNLGDTIDPRQKDQTHTALVALNDIWQFSSSQQFQLSSFFRTYNLSLYSDFGQGLIRQSEFRTVAGGSANYVNKISEHLSLLGGFDYQREAPRRDDLDHYGFIDPRNPDYYGSFLPVASNNLTISPFTPYVAAEGGFGSHFRYYLGWRRDEINFNNRDLLHSDNSFQRWAGVNSPKATVSFWPKDSWFLPLVSLSFGQAFFTNDPRIGTGSVPPSPVNTAHSYQLVASKTMSKTDIRLTLGHVTTSQTLGQLDADTGLQEDQGPGRLRFATIAVRRNFSRGSLLATFSKADARDLASGKPTPEAPRTLIDFLGTAQRLPMHLQARAEFEYIAAKPLGTGCLTDPDAECFGAPVKEIRVAFIRPFLNERLTIGVNMLFARGRTGQTLEAFAPSDVPEVAGVRIPAYASGTLAYRFGRTAH